MISVLEVFAIRVEHVVGRCQDGVDGHHTQDEKVTRTRFQHSLAAHGGGTATVVLVHDGQLPGRVGAVVL